MENRIYPTIKNAIFLCLLCIGIQVIMGLIIGVFQVILNLSDNSPLMGILLIMTSITSFGIVLLIGFKKTKRKIKEVFRFNNVSPFLWLAIVLFSIGFVVVSSEMDNLLGYFLPMPDMFREMFVSLMVNQSLMVAIIHIGIVAAFTEELFFRGLILDGFINNYSKKKTIIISALFFGLIHLNPWQFLTAFILGLVMAWICIETKSIWLCIYIHLFNNVLYTITERYNDLIPIRGFNSAFGTSVEFQPLWFTLTGLIILSIGVIMLIKGTQKAKTFA